MASVVLGREITELRLGLPGDDSPVAKKRVFFEISSDADDENSTSDDGNKNPKNQVVGWPPVCSYRQKMSLPEKKNDSEIKKIYVKVSLDGAPFLRKIDLNGYNGYSDLSIAIEKLFGCFGIGSFGIKDSENSEYIPIYEDKDGDWMLVGDVPWEMFIESCKRLRIMKGSDAKGFGLQTKTPPHISKAHQSENHAASKKYESRGHESRESLHFL
ncbi:auxin-induced protein IAA6-like [Magnolia sinica]|uniref:auxin-induced protein IAA6-like n=1 Tax=Magnolia sinica TaxID=86752 RepID=UPI002658DA93|nr:auxin-induced protein IAA6-like [Magnolia sinica]